MWKINKPEQWDNYLPFITFAINTSKQASTKVGPFEAMFGRKPNLPHLSGEIKTTSFKTFTAETWYHHLNHFLPILHENIKSKLQTSQERQQKYFNKNRKIKEKIQVGDEVYKIKLKTEWKFPNPKFTRPWTVMEITTDGLSFKLTRKDKNEKNITTTANIRDIYRRNCYVYSK